MVLNCIGIRKEDEQKKFERRTPLTPADIRELLREFPDASFVVESSQNCIYKRAFTDDEYAQAGATIGALDDADIILGIKEVPIHDILPNRVYVNFSHTYKGQPHNMAMLRKFKNLNCTLIDYELIVENIDDYVLDQHRREVFFGHYAGYAGAINSLWALGQRLKHESIANPFEIIRQSVDYQASGKIGEFAAAMQAVDQLSTLIQSEGLPNSLSLIVFGITGGGNAASAVKSVFEHLPIVEIAPEDLLNFHLSDANHHIYLVQFRREHRERAIFEQYMRQVTLLVNCIKWKSHHERLVTRQFLKDLYSAGQPRLRVIGDVSCDPNGSIEITQATYPDAPTYVYEPGKDDLAQPWDQCQFHATAHFGFAGHGPVVMAVVNLPAEFPRDSSTAFSGMLKKFIPDLLQADFSRPLETLNMSRQLKRAVILHHGDLTPDFAYLSEKLSGRILLLGAGLMSPAVISYLIAHGYHVTVADANLEQAVMRVKNYPPERVQAIQLAVSQESHAQLIEELKQVDVAISLLPASLHAAAAELCIETRTHLVTASYTSQDMRKLDERAKAAGVILLNEVGLDPGLDHMSALRAIEQIHAAGGKISRFTSYCGGLPHADSANNPLRFKASWSPAGIVSAANRPARFKQDGAIRTIEPRQLFHDPLIFRFDGVPFDLEAYPNGDSEAYIQLYGLGEAHTFIRGTLRYAGWCRAFSDLHDLGWFSNRPAVEVSRATAESPQMHTDVGIVCDWMGLNRVENAEITAYDYLLSRFQSQPDLAYAPGERDLIVMRHTFDVEYPQQKFERITSSLVAIGESNGLSAMSSTVGLTSAICARLIAEKQYARPGVQIPFTPDLYIPVLDEIVELGFAFHESIEIIEA
jgi:alpha-aminoadipic semialdehyde synthase